MDRALYANLEVSKPKHGQVEITGEIPAALLATHYGEVLEHLRRDFEVPGFRKGSVPLEMLAAQINTRHVLEDAAEEALQEAYPAILESENIKAIGRPAVTITKLAEGNPMEFSIRLSVPPEIKLPNYKKIGAEAAAGKKPAEVSDKEIEDVILSLRKMRSAPSAPAAGEKPAAEPKSEDFPPLTDEFVKTLGNFQNVEDFKIKLRGNMILEKQAENKRALREDIAAKLAAETKMEISDLLLDEESEEMMNRLRADLKHANMSMEDYLKRSGKTEADILKDERTYAERQIKTRFILEAIAEAEKIEPTEADVRAEARLLKERYPDLDAERINDYVRSIMRNEKVLEFLESQK